MVVLLTYKRAILLLSSSETHLRLLMKLTKTFCHFLTPIEVYLNPLKCGNIGYWNLYHNKDGSLKHSVKSMLANCKIAPEKE